MNKYVVCVYAICKDEEKHIHRWMDSMSEADYIVVADTGSKDNSVKMLKERGAIVENIKVEPFRFDKARNLSMQYIPKDTNICICTDLDEVFKKGWRKLLEEAWNTNTTRLKYSYTWNFNQDGTPGVTFLYEKIHKNGGFKWVHPVHEILEYFGDEPDVYAYEPKIQLNHLADPNKSRSSYLPLLELSVKEDPEDDRNMHYLGREYMFYKKYDKCIETLKKHLTLKNATWKDERGASMRYIARCYNKKGNIDEAINWYNMAINETPYLREPYVEMAMLAYSLSDFKTVYDMGIKAINITEKPVSYINEGFCWDYTIYDLLSISCYNLNMLDQSIQYAKIAYDMSPENERLKSNYDLLKNMKKT